MKNFIAIGVILAVLIGFTACKTSINLLKDKVVVTESPQNSADAPKENSSGTNIQLDKPQESKTASAITEANLPLKDNDITAVYAGQIDGNSIEVKIDGKNAALFFSSSVKSSFDTSLFKSGSTVQVTYNKNEMGQLILTSIKSATYGISVPGVYVGQIDNNSIEVKINGKPTAFYLSDKFVQSFKPDEFKAGADIRVFYYKNSKGQVVLTGLQ